MAWAKSRGLIDDAADVAERAHAWMLLGNAETWSYLVGSAGWGKDKYGAWLLRTFRSAVFDPAVTPSERAATS